MLSSAELFFILFYWLLFTAILLKARYFKNFGITERWIAGIFLLKLVFGITYGVIHFRVYAGGDTFGYFYDSRIAMSALPDHPLNYLQLIFGINHRPPDAAVAMYAYQMNYSTDMSSYFIIRLHSIMNLFTFCHYYGNVVIYNFFTLIGQLYLFKFFAGHLPGKKIALLILLFAFPSVAFWCSGMHKDGIAVAAIGLILFHAEYLFNAFIEIKQKNRTSQRNTTHAYNSESLNGKNFLPGKLSALLLLLAGAWLLIVVRNYLLLLIIPCLIAYYYTLYSGNKTALKYTAVIILLYIIIFQLKILNPQWDILNQMALKQQEFLAGGDGKTSIDLAPLHPDIISLLLQTPAALFNCLFRPAFFSLSSPLQLSSAIDNLLILLLFFAALLTMRPDLKTIMPTFLLCLFFAASVFIFTGAIVPNIGALVRYKMPGTLFLATGLLCMMDTAKIKRWIPFN